MFDWNSTFFPAPSVAYNNKVESSTIETKMDSSRTRTRARYTRQTRIVSVQWELTDDQYALFQGVFTYKLTRGADFFSIDLYLGGGLRNFKAKFKSDPIDTAYKDVLNWVVRGTLEIESGSVLTSGETDTALAALPP